MSRPSYCVFFFFFNDTATTEIYTLSLHDALPISSRCLWKHVVPARVLESVDPAALVRIDRPADHGAAQFERPKDRSEEHTSELQSRLHLVCRLLLEKKKNKKQTICHTTTQQR